MSSARRLSATRSEDLDIAGADTSTKRRTSSRAAVGNIETWRKISARRGENEPEIDHHEETVKLAASMPISEKVSFCAGSTIAICATTLSTDAKAGLKDSQVEGIRDGRWNELDKAPRRTRWEMFIDQFKDVLVILLMIAAVVSAVIAIATRSSWEEYIAPAFICLIVVANAWLGVTMEGKADDAVAKLESKQKSTMDVIRDGNLKEIQTRELVPGDVFTFKMGDIIPADSRVIESQKLEMNEAMLTGEGEPVKKNFVVTDKLRAEFEEDLEKNAASKKTETKEPKEGDEEAPKAGKAESVNEKVCIILKGTSVANGNGKAIAITTGMDTKMGGIAAQLSGIEDEASPLQIKLEKLGFMLGLWAIALSLVVMIWGIISGLVLGNFAGTDPYGTQSPYIQLLLIAVSLVVAAVPEGMPACVTIALSGGMGSMSEKHVTVKALKSVETLGCTSVINSDKTGTLTSGVMTVVDIQTLENAYTIDGKGKVPEGNISPASWTEDKEVKCCLAVASYCNSSQVKKVFSKEEGKADQCTYEYTADFTNNALRRLAIKSGINFKEHDWKGSSKDTLYKILDQRPFNSTRKMESCTVSLQSDEKDGLFGNTSVTLVKGAAEVVLGRCVSVSIGGQAVPLDKKQRETILTQISTFASQAKRCLALAYTNDIKFAEREALDIEKDLTYLGLVALIDPPREGVKESIQKAHAAGVQVRMITGDNAKTAEAIAKDIGILTQDSVGEAIECADFRVLKDTGKMEAMKEMILKTHVFARAQPQDKIDIITTLQNAGEVCSMTGDGVNDALALKKADIGVAMGIAGTEAAKSAAKMILETDDFTNIVEAMQEGRRIYANIAKFVYFLLSTNIAEVIVILMTSFIGLQSPLVPVQILWLNLMTDSLPAIALAFEDIEFDLVMKAPPRPKTSNIIDKLMIYSVAAHTIVLTASTLGIYIWGLTHFTGNWQGMADEAYYVNAGVDPLNYEGLTEEAYPNLDIDYDGCADDWMSCFTPDGGTCDLFDNCEVIDTFQLQIRQAQTMVIFSIVFAELLRGYTSRSLVNSVFSLGFFSNSFMQASVFGAIGLTFLAGLVPGLNGIFGMEVLDGPAWGMVIGFSIGPAILDELLKMYYRFKHFGEIEPNSVQKEHATKIAAI